MSSSLARIPPGVHYIFDAEVRLRRWIEQTVMRVFEGWSYSEIILPIFDYADLFALGMGKEQAEMTYRFTGRDGKLLALRPEMTSLVARTVATRFRQRKPPIRLSYSGEVFRWNEPRNGRQYEFHQIGLEHIGSESIEADTEVLLVAVEALRELGLDDFTITLGHVGFFNGVAARLALDENQRHQMRELIDKKETDQLGEFLEAFADAGTRNSFCRLTTLVGKHEVIQEARALVSNITSRSAVDDLESVYRIAEEIGIDKYIDIDLGDVAGLDYYTGLTFKIFAPGLGSALGRGGRYDQLLSKFGVPAPAVGFSICLDWLAGLLSSRADRSPSQGQDQGVRLETGTDLVTTFSEASRLRAAGVRVEITKGNG